MVISNDLAMILLTFLCLILPSKETISIRKEEIQTVLSSGTRGIITKRGVAALP